jgi:putative transposase
VNRYPGRLAHRTPSWVDSGATFHIRISAVKQTDRPLTTPDIGAQLLASAGLYHDKGRWHCRLLLLMPDHLHALLIFSSATAMGPVPSSWKGYHAKRLGLTWQNNFFDHRIRTPGKLKEAEAYIRQNPVRRNLCAEQSAWPWLISCA